MVKRKFNTQVMVRNLYEVCKTLFHNINEILEMCLPNGFFAFSLYYPYEKTCMNTGAELK